MGGMESVVTRLKSLRPPWPVSHLLAAYVLALALPLFVLISIDAVRVTATERSQLFADATRASERISSDVDQALTSYGAILHTLATSNALKTKDFGALYAQAEAALRQYGLHAFLRDSTGQQIMNTRVPYGTPLPRSQNFSVNEPFVSDLVVGEVAKHYVIGVNVPVKVEDETYVLSLSLEPTLFKSLLDRQKLPEGWVATIFDRNRTVIARSRLNDVYLGTVLSEETMAERRETLVSSNDLEGKSVLWGHARSELSDWSVFVSIPTSQADAVVRSSLITYAAIVAVVMAMGLASAFMVARFITRPLDDAARAARALGEGRAVSFEPSLVVETNAIGNALTDAARKRAEADQRILLLMREVNHRSKNMLAVVQAIARQMMGADPKTFVRRFSDRIVGLAASQDLLIDSNWQGVELRDLVERQLALFRDLLGSRIFVAGPGLRLSPSAAQAIGMALHELETNAGKYGALSDEKGRVDVSWHTEKGDDGEPRFVMSWTERDGPPPSEPSQRGFGYTIMVTMIEKSLNGKVKVTYEASGLVWRIEAPLALLSSD